MLGTINLLVATKTYGGFPILLLASSVCILTILTVPDIFVQLSLTNIWRGTPLLAFFGVGERVGIWVGCDRWQGPTDAPTNSRWRPVPPSLRTRSIELFQNFASYFVTHHLMLFPCYVGPKCPLNYLRSLGDNLENMQLFFVKIPADLLVLTPVWSLHAIRVSSPWLRLAIRRYPPYWGLRIRFLCLDIDAVTWLGSSLSAFWGVIFIRWARVLASSCIHQSFLWPVAWSFVISGRHAPYSECGARWLG